MICLGVPHDSLSLLQQIHLMMSDAFLNLSSAKTLARVLFFNDTTLHDAYELALWLLLIRCIVSHIAVNRTHQSREPGLFTMQAMRNEDQ